MFGRRGAPVRDSQRSSACARPAMHYGPAGSGLSRVPLRRRKLRADGQGTVSGPGRAECSHPIPGSSDSGGCEPSPPQPDSPGTGLAASSPALRRLSALPGDGRRFRRGLLRGPGGLLAFAPQARHPRLPSGFPDKGGIRRAHPPLSRVPEVPRGPLRCLPGMRSNSADYDFASAGCCFAAGGHARRFRCVGAIRAPTDGTCSRACQPRTGPAGVSSPLARCGLIRGRSAPYTPRPCRLLLPLRRRNPRADGQIRTRGYTEGIRR